MLKVHGVTHTGLVRRTNEDAFFGDEALGVFMVADGMGGHNAGEVASALAIDTLRTFIVRSAEVEGCTWPYGIDPNLSFNGNRILTAMRLANRRVFRAGEARDEYTGMGSTGAAVLISEGVMTFASVGDTRIYLCRNGELVQLTADDTWGNRIRSLDPATLPTTIQHGPMDHVLTKVLGATAEIELTIHERALQPGDRALLCSDGLHNAVDIETLRAIVGGQREVVPTVEALLQTALERGGRDNVTAYLVEYGGAD